MKQALILLSAFLVATSALANESILITAFEPFGGSFVNQSRSVAEALVKMINTNGIGGKPVDAKLCILPTVYDKGALVAEKCYKAMAQKPKVVLSLGEAACTIDLESRAKNWDSDGEDNNGNDRTGSEIVKDGPEYVSLGFPVDEMMGLVPPPYLHRVLRSTDMGGYVCNNTAYHLALYFKAEPTTYSFIHVPNSNCGAVKNANTNAQIIATLLTTVL